MNIVLIRHFATKGNIERRYVGTTDEDVVLFRKYKYPKCETVFSSPLKRCLQTAESIYGNEIIVNSGLREVDFGEFEYKNFDELKDSQSYKAWISSGGTLDFPKGEGLAEFKKRTVESFMLCAEQAGRFGSESTAFVIHGGGIMAILSHFLGRGFYDFQVKNGGGYICCFEKGILEITGEIHV